MNCLGMKIIYIGLVLSALVPQHVLGVVQKVVTGTNHTCVLVDGGVKCAGGNFYGELGNGTKTHSLNWVQVGGISSGTANDLAAGYYFSCAVQGSSVVCWGRNNAGNLGDGTTKDAVFPVQVKMPHVVSGASVYAGKAHACVLDRSRIGQQVYCWGSNAKGQLGAGYIPSSYVPVAVTGFDADESVRDLALGIEHTCALTNKGVRCWGGNGSGQLGTGSSTDAATLYPAARVPLALEVGTIVAISAGDYHTCVSGTNRTLCWGANVYGQVGPNLDAMVLSPMTITDQSGVELRTKLIMAGRDYTCGVDAQGGVHCWGRNDGGQLGSGTSQRVVGKSFPVSGLSSGVTSIGAPGI